MPEINPDFPVQGERPWGNKLNAALGVMVDAINDNIDELEATGDEAVAKISDVTEAIAAQAESDAGVYIPQSDKALANGVATLDGGGKIPATQLPSTVMEYKGVWDASTNTPTLANGTGNAGDVWLTDVAGSVDFGSGTIVFSIGDWAVYSGAIWERSINSNAVVSVNGQFGEVSLDATDVGADPTGSAQNVEDSLSTVATTGAYADLSGLPTLGTIASHAATDFDPSGSASNAQTNAENFATSAVGTAISSEVSRSNSAYVTLRAAAKNPDILIVGSITRNANEVITSGSVIWPDDSPGTFTTDNIDTSSAINGYHITYGSPVTKTFTQPTITRDANGAATIVPQIVVS